MNISKYVDEYQDRNQPNDRYASFDYCYRYFRLSSSEQIKADLEKSCLALAFYLASWGMLRGSGFLLQKSVRYYKEAVLYIANLDKAVWEIDVDVYDNNNIKKIIDIYSDIQQLMIEGKSEDLTIVTKILLGVFGFVPAFDQYFRSAMKDWSDGQCGFTVVNTKALSLIGEFYQKNRDTINQYSSTINVRSFSDPGSADLHYPKVKVIDMWGFCRGYEIKRDEKEKSKPIKP